MPKSKPATPEAVADAQRPWAGHGSPAKGELEAVAVYEVDEGKIVRVTFLEK